MTHNEQQAIINAWTYSIPMDQVKAFVKEHFDLDVDPEDIAGVYREEDAEFREWCESFDKRINQC